MVHHKAHQDGLGCICPFNTQQREHHIDRAYHARTPPRLPWGANNSTKTTKLWVPQRSTTMTTKLWVPDQQHVWELVEVVATTGDAITGDVTVAVHAPQRRPPARLRTRQTWLT